MQIIEEGNFIKIFHNDQIYQKFNYGDFDWEILKEYNGQTTSISLLKPISDLIEQEYQKERTRIYREKKLNRIISKEI